jgi:hypothetical protein
MTITKGISFDLPVPPGRGMTPERAAIEDKARQLKPGHSVFVYLKDRTLVQMQGMLQSIKKKVERETGRKLTTKRWEQDGKVGYRLWCVE